MSDPSTAVDQSDDRPMADLAPSARAEAALREPEKLVIPAEAVGDLMSIAFRSQEGNAWWRGFVTAHGSPSWITGGQWGLLPQPIEVVRATRPERNGRA